MSYLLVSAVILVSPILLLQRAKVIKEKKKKKGHKCKHSANLRPASWPFQSPSNSQVLSGKQLRETTLHTGNESLSVLVDPGTTLMVPSPLL